MLPFCCTTAFPDPITQTSRKQSTWRESNRTELHPTEDVSYRTIQINLTADTTSLEVVGVLSLQLFSQLLVVVVVVVILSGRPLLSTPATLGSLLGRLRGLRGALALSAVLGIGVFSSSLASLLAAVEGASHLLELRDAVGDGFGGAIYQKELVESRGREWWALISYRVR